MIKNRTKFALIMGIGLSLSSGLSQAALATINPQDRHLIAVRPAISAATCGWRE